MENNLLLPVALFVSSTLITCTLHKRKGINQDKNPPSSLTTSTSSTSASMTRGSTNSPSQYVSDTNSSKSLSTAEPIIPSSKTQTQSQTQTPSLETSDCIDCSSPLADTAPKVDRHLLICGKFEDIDWPKKIEKEKDTFACALAAALTEAAAAVAVSAPSDAASPFNVKMTACNEPNTLPGYYDIIVYPEKIKYSVPSRDLDCLTAFATYVSLPALPLSTSASTSLPPGVIQSPHALPWETLILVCTHGSRDKRCGRAGPILITALEAELSHRQHDVPACSKIAVRASSHIGGHRYAGTLIVYPQGQWYGFMTKKSVKPLLDSVLAGGILDKCFRGLGNVSW